MSSTVAADAYDRFMGRYSSLLAPQFADLSKVAAGQRVLDVGCGPGALTHELVKRLEPAAVSAVDPSEPFVAAVQERHPGVSVQRAAAEELPFGDDEFDAALAQLVVHFMTDPVAGLREMARVTRTDGVVAACVWDHAGGHGPLSLFWDAARQLDPDVEDESQFAGARERHLARLLQAAGLREIEEDTLSVSLEHGSFEDLVGAVHARRGTRRRLHDRSRREAAGSAARTLPRDVARALRADGPGLGCARPRLARAWAYEVRA